ncbi:hypothetical protein [Streptomyces sp. NPDC008121]|uniref:hypothetical protein n=1 Tax=Streptomyces sp. NPDC008121 TaxID=3364809 RepID=UPI0036E030ED
MNVANPALCGLFAAIVWGLSANMRALKNKTTEDSVRRDSGHRTSPMGGDQ